MSGDLEKYYDDLSESEIWDEFRNGSQKAFEFIYKKHFKALYNYGYQFTKDRFLIEDQIHNVFVDLKIRASFLSPTVKILPYLYTAFRRSIIKARDHSNKTSNQFQKEPFTILSSIEDRIIDSEIEDEQKNKISKALGALSSKQREILYYFYNEGLTYEEIKEIVGFSNVKSVRNLLYKTIDLIKILVRQLVIIFEFFNNFY